MGLRICLACVLAFSLICAVECDASETDTYLLLAPIAQVADVNEAEALTTPGAGDDGMVDLKDFEFRLSNVNRWRSIDHRILQPNTEPLRSERISLTLALVGPEGVDIFKEFNVRRGEASPDLLTALRDQDGNDLRDDNANIVCNLYGGGHRISNTKRAMHNGGLIIFLEPPPAVTSLSLVEGYVVADLTLEKGTLEVEPLPENLNKAYKIGDGILEFVEFSFPKIGYRWTPSVFTENYAAQGTSLVYRSADGNDIGCSNRHIVRGEKSWIIEESLMGALAPGGKLVITYPAKIAKVKLPFKLENVPLP